MASQSTIMQEQLLLSIPINIKKDTFAHCTIDASAVDLAMTAQCSESEESSDDSCSSDESLEEESIGYSPTSSPEMVNTETMSTFAPRRPTSLSMSPTCNRRASSPSQRSHHATSNSIRSASHCIPSFHSRRAPSVSMRHDAALRAFQQKQDSIDVKRMPKTKPSMVDLTVIPKSTAPRIEIEQVFDDGKASEEIIAEAELAKKEQLEAKANDRSAARKRMLNALGRGQSKALPSTSDGQDGKIITSSVRSNDNLHQTGLFEVQDLKTPGTASYFGHQSNKSCPSPTNPYNELLGCVNVFVTPPTPRPQGSFSPILGVSISGIHRSAAFDSHHSIAKSLAPPPFELAPGKQRVAREQNAKALAWVASMQLQQQQMQLLYQQQQQFLLSSMQQQQQLPFGSFDARAFGIFEPSSIQSPADPTWNLPTTTRAPSMAYIQQQKAVQAQQQMMNQYSTSTVDNGGSSRKGSQKSNRTALVSKTSNSWWRRAPTDVDGNKSADEALHWRRRDSDPTEKLVQVKSAKPVYLPPGKRAACETQRQVLRGRA